jgi:hypothetical protein
MIIAIDFDNTLFESNSQTFAIGRPNLGLINYVQYMQQSGHKIILWTTRCGKALDEAVDMCLEYGLHFDAVNDNLPEIIETWGGNSRKVYYDVLIDDKNFTGAFRNPDLDKQIFEQAQHKR